METISERNHTVFLSHQSDDKSFVEHVYRDLKNANIDCCLDKIDIKPGDSIGKKIDENLAKCRVFIAFISDEYFESYWCQDEYQKAIKNTYTKILIVKLSGCSQQTSDGFLAKNNKTRNRPKIIEATDHELTSQELLSCITDTYLSSSSQIEENQILSKYHSTLFLENRFKGIQATLRDVYVDPYIDEEPSQDFLKKWSSNKKSKILVISGKSGVGKTSFTSNLLYEQPLLKSNGKLFHATVLRNHIDVFEDNINALKKVEKCFDLSHEFYKSISMDKKILILDGLDEVKALVRNNSFDAEKFIDELIKEIPENLKIIITTRPFLNPNGNPNGKLSAYIEKKELECKELKWNDNCINEWCQKYSNIHQNDKQITEWFKKNTSITNNVVYNEATNSIIKIPLILYSCCVNNVNITNISNYMDLYNDIFNNIYRKTYDDNIDKDEYLKKEKIHKQFSKELAYQMFLNNELHLDVTNVKNARERTKIIIDECYESDFDNAFEIYYGIMPFSSTDGMESFDFSHKSIYEYFLTLKIYEDYIVELLSSNIDNKLTDFIKKSSDKDVKNQIQKFLGQIFPKDSNVIMNNYSGTLLSDYLNQIIRNDLKTMYIYEIFIQAFGYNILPDEVWNNIELLLNKDKATNKGQLHSLLNKNDIFNAFNDGMEKNVLWTEFSNVKIIQQYDRNISASPFNRIIYTFYNTLNFLRILGYNNNKYQSNDNDKFMDNFIHLLSLTVTHGFEYNFDGWNFNKCNLYHINLDNLSLSNSYFQEAQLYGAGFCCADLEYANLECADLECANLEGANLKYANLRRANLYGANLRKVNLQYANLEGAILREADVEGADIRGANLADVNLYGANFDKAIGFRK